MDEHHFNLSSECIEACPVCLNQRYKPRSVKRKIAAIKSFCSFLSESDNLFENPFYGMRIKIAQRKTLPRTILLWIIDSILIAAHDQVKHAETKNAYLCALKEAAVLELFFATGIRVSELCNTENKDLDLKDGLLLIHGKGNKERVIDIENPEMIRALEKK